MVKSTAQINGYTLIELVITIAIIGVISIIAFFGLSNFNGETPVNNATKELISILRTTQNNVQNGSGGKSVRFINIPADGGTSYTINDNTGVIGTIVLPRGATISNNRNPSSGVSICFANPAVSSFSAPNTCGACISGSNGFICDSGSLVSPTEFNISISRGSYTRTVYIDGQNMIISRIYGK